MNIVEVLEKKAKELVDKPAIIFKEQPVSFLQLKDTCFKLADSLKNLGIKKDDKVAIYLPNWPEYIYSYLAIWLLGATAVPLDFMLTEDELVSCLSHSQIKALITKHKANISLAGLKVNIPSLKDIIICHEKIDGSLNFEELLEKGRNQVLDTKVQDKDYSIIFYTSGTTGKPKGVLINYKQLEAPAKSMGFFVGGIKKDDTALCALPFSHLGGLIYIQNCIFHAMTFVLMERFIPLEFLKNIQNYKITCFWVVPSMYYALLQLKEFESFDLSTLRWIVTFGASNSPEALRRFHQYCP